MAQPEGPFARSPPPTRKRRAPTQTCFVAHGAPCPCFPPRLRRPRLSGGVAHSFRGFAIERIYLLHHALTQLADGLAFNCAVGYDRPVTPHFLRLYRLRSRSPRSFPPQLASCCAPLLHKTGVDNDSIRDPCMAARMSGTPRR